MTPRRSNMLTPLAFFGLLVLVALSACAGRQDFIYQRASGPPARLRKAQVVLAPTQFLYALAGHDESTMFAEQTGVGFMHHTGGFVRDEGMGGDTHSAAVTIGERAVYELDLERWLAQEITTLLRRRGHTWTELDRATFAGKLPPPERSRRRAAPAEDGNDNINAPYYDLHPPRSLTDPPIPKGVVLLVPVVAYYYAHNTAWYYGQTWGSPAGCRLRVMLAAYTDDGQLLDWREFDVRHLEPFVFHPNRPMSERIIAMCQEKGAKALVKVTKGLL